MVGRSASQPGLHTTLQSTLRRAAFQPVELTAFQPVQAKALRPDSNQMASQPMGARSALRPRRKARWRAARHQSGHPEQLATVLAAWAAVDEGQPRARVRHPRRSGRSEARQSLPPHLMPLLCRAGLQCPLRLVRVLVAFVGSRRSNLSLYCRVGPVTRGTLLKNDKRQTSLSIKHKRKRAEDGDGEGPKAEARDQPNNQNAQTSKHANMHERYPAWERPSTPRGCTHTQVQSVQP